MINNRQWTNGWRSVLIASVLFFCFSRADANPGGFLAYPGKYSATLVSVESPHIIHLKALVWEGSYKLFRITLPDLEVPMNVFGAPPCQQELAERAMAFSEDFLHLASKIFVFDIRMENTGQGDGSGHIYTEQGSLAEALIKAGLARSLAEQGKPWCS